MDAVVLDLSFNSGDFLNNVKIICREVADPTQIPQGKLVFSLREQPPWGFLDPHRTDEQAASGDELYRKGNEPLFPRRRHCLLEAVVDPEADKAADLPFESVSSMSTA
jgi:hypothetical protein